MADMDRSTASGASELPLPEPEDTVFWQRMGPALEMHGRPHTAQPPASLAADIRARVAPITIAPGPGERTTAQRPAFVAWMPWLLAAASLLAVVWTLSPKPRETSSVVFNDFGMPVVLPEDVASDDGYQQLDRRYVRHAVAAQPREHRVPCLGVIMQPTDFARGNTGTGRGLHVIGVYPGSPADLISIVPGDVLLRMNNHALCTRHCLREALFQQQIDQQVMLTLWDSRAGEVVERPVVLGAFME